MTKIFFGEEDEPDARFIQLRDCGHIIEYKALDYWMESRYGEDASANGEDAQVDKRTIQCPECPQCKTQIRRSLRYSKYIKLQQRAIEGVKAKMNANESLKSIRNRVVNLRRSIAFDDSRPKPGFEISFRELEGKPENISNHQLISISNKIEITKSIIAYKEEANTLMYDDQEAILFELERLTKAMYPNFSNVTFLSKQKAAVLSFELKRIRAVLNLNQFERKSKSQQSQYPPEIKLKIDEAMQKMREILWGKKIKRFEEKEQEQVNQLSKELNTLTGILTQEEKTMIHKAMEFGKGHWFKCPNGHIYCIGECGGAMEKSVCPECKSEIGGKQKFGHLLPVT